MTALSTGIMPRCVHGTTDTPSSGRGRPRQLRTREGPRVTEFCLRAVFRPQKPLHIATSHRSAYHQQSKC